MPRYHCVKCDEKMHSKNPSCRSVFCDDQHAAILTNVLGIETTVKENGKRKTTLTFLYDDGDAESELTDDELEIKTITRFIANLAGQEDTIRHWLCEHHWELDAGQPEPTIG